jgi:hypothetical protein
VPAHDRADEVGLGTEVVADGGIVALTGGLTDLPVGDGENTVFGEQLLSGSEDGLQVPSDRSARPDLRIVDPPVASWHPVNQQTIIKSSD